LCRGTPLLRQTARCHYISASALTACASSLEQGPAPGAPVRSPGLLSTAFRCSAHADSTGSPAQEWRGIEGAGGPNRAEPTAINHTSLCRTPDDLQGSTPRAALPLTGALAYGMALHSHADMPVVKEWHAARNRPHECSVEGCASQPVTKTHLRARLCAAHIKCLAMLHGGVPQRWCGNCHRFHTLDAFSGSLRCATALRLDCSGHPQD